MAQMIFTQIFVILIDILRAIRFPPWLPRGALAAMISTANTGGAVKHRSALVL